MPLVDSLGVEPLVYLNGSSDVSFHGSTQSFLFVTIHGHASLFLDGSGNLPAAIAIHGTSGKDWFGRLNSDPNRFGAVAIHGSGSLAMNPRFLAAGKCIIHGVSSVAFKGRLAGGDSSECQIFLSIVDPIDPGSGGTYSARLIADGVGYRIRAFDYTESKDTVGISLNLTLQKPTDRDAILAAASFQFDLYVNGSWQTLVAGGMLAGGGFSFAWQDGRPDDQLTIQTSAQITDKLGQSPDLNTTVYDPFVETIDASKYKDILDTNGHHYSHQLVAFNNMTLSVLFHWLFVTKLGFAGVVTNLPDFPIPRADFNMTDTYLSGLRGVIGNFDPLIFVEGNKIVILDSTLRLPAGMPASIVLDPSLYLNAQFSETEFAADGFLVSYIENDSEYDYQQTRDVVIPTSTTGTFGSNNYTETDITQTFTDFYKLSDPATPVRSEKTKEQTTVRAMMKLSPSAPYTLQEISDTTETIEFDSKMRLTSIQKNVIALIPNLTSGVPFNFVTDFVRSERTTFEYNPDVFDPKREYLSAMKKTVSGLVATDNDPDKANIDGSPFKQDFFDAWRAGNLSFDMQVANEPIQEITENAQQTRKGQIEIRKKTVEYLTNPPATIHQVTDGRTGDISQNAQSGSSATIIVYRDGISFSARGGRKLVPINVGNMPPRFFIPLCRRKLQLRKRRSGAVTTKGLMLSLVRGSAIGVLDHYGQSAGNYLIEGRRIAGSNLGTRQQTTRQILEVSQI